MAVEPANPAKMTPADIERERQAFREQHSKAKQAAIAAGAVPKVKILLKIPYCTVTNPRFENPQVINPNANNARGAHIINKHSASLCEVLLALWLHVHEYSRACVRMYREATSWKGTYIDALEVITWLGYIQTQNVS